MVTHNPEIALYADRIIQMVDGKIASDTKEPIKMRDPARKRPLNSYRKAAEALERLLDRNEQEKTKKKPKRGKK
jgi:energy-coupling factor transporter ATP-binding protein EcfA2